MNINTYWRVVKGNQYYIFTSNIKEMSRNFKIYAFSICLIITACLLYLRFYSYAELIKIDKETVNATKRMNVLFLVSDDMRPQLGSYLGPEFPSPVSPPMHTPNLDALASKSLLLKRAYVQQAHCSPSRTSLLTGRRPDTTRVYKGQNFRKVGGNFTTIPEYFKLHGYTSIGMGKIFHRPSTDPLSWSGPFYRGVENFESEDFSWRAVPDRLLIKKPLIDEHLARHAIKTLHDLSKDALSGKKPFFLAVGFRKPHLPFVFPESMLNLYPAEVISLPDNPYAPVDMPKIAWHNYTSLFRFNDIKALKASGKINTTLPDKTVKELRRAYYCALSWADLMVGRVLDELERLGLADNTIVSFWGDHGWQLGEHGEWQKMTNFEIATHAPMMIRIPGLTDNGVSTRQLTEFVDLFPTLVEAAGLPRIPLCPKDSTKTKVCTEGASMIPLIKNPATPLKKAAFSQYHRSEGGVNLLKTMGYSMRTDRYRYTEWVKFEAFKPVWDQLYGVELYDHVEDPQENRNRAYNTNFKAVRQELSRQLHAGWRDAAFGVSVHSTKDTETIIRVSNSLDPDEAPSYSAPHLDPNCLQRMVVGFRVVRGSDWTQGDKDGGQHHVGTITEIKEDNSVEVTWDTGQVTECCAGADRKNDLRVFDSGPRGVRHRYIRCEGCETTDIIGTRWRCCICDNVSLCTPCYHDDGHDTTHPFERIDFPGLDRVKVEKRSESERDRVMGLYPDAEVTRGAHWEYGDQDGGEGSWGVVQDIVDYNGEPCRSGVTVRWHDGDTTQDYRVGHRGKVDLCCRQAAPGADYYYEHLARVDLSQYLQWHEETEVLRASDRVYIDRPMSEIKELLQRHGYLGDSVPIEELAGAVGVLKSLTSEGKAEVDFNVISVSIDENFLAKVPKHNVGDTVRVIGLKDKLQMLQQKHGGWEDDVEQAMGKLGVVKVIDTDGDVGVSFGKVNIVFHPASLIPSPGETCPDGQHRGHTETKQAQEEERRNSNASAHANINTADTRAETPEFLQSFGGLAFLQAMAVDQAMYKHVFVKAVFENNEMEVRRLIQQHPDLRGVRVSGIPCISFAAHQGNTNIIRVLLDAGTDIDMLDENRYTPLHVALQAQQGDAARLLIDRGAHISAADKTKRSPLHIAALFNMYSIVKLLLEKGCDPNVQDLEKNTPLHLAIYNGHDQVVDFLIQHPDVNTWLKNSKLFNALSFACLRAHALAVDKLITTHPLLVDSIFSKASEGFLPLHIAAVNNHVEEARLLLEKGKAFVNARNDKCITPLHLATSEGYISMTELLLTHGADCLLKDLQGNIPLHACLVGRRTDGMPLFGFHNPQEDEERIKVAIRLLQHSSTSIEVSNNFGAKPLDVCLVPRIRDAVTSYVSKTGDMYMSMETLFINNSDRDVVYQQC